MPPTPLRVALVTSGDGDARHDVERTLVQSGFAFETTLADVRVQGEGAAHSVAEALGWAGWQDVDVVVLVRGGGSASDLATFDDEVVARAIAACRHPVVTGLGHEQDRSVADEAAHTAARTPTGAAQVLVDLVGASWAETTRLAGAIGALAERRLERAAARLDATENRIRRVAHGTTAAERVRLDAYADRVRRACEQRVRAEQTTLAGAARRLAAVPGRLAGVDQRLDVLAARVDAVDPARALARGWSITTGADGGVVRRVGDVAAGDRIRTRLADGTVVSVVE